MRQHYIEEYNKFWNKCVAEAKANPDVTDIRTDATEHFEECANADQIVGYYLTFYGDDALKVWIENTSGITLSSQDIQVETKLRKEFPHEV